MDYLDYIGWKRSYEEMLASEQALHKYNEEQKRKEKTEWKNVITK